MMRKTIKPIKSLNKLILNPKIIEIVVDWGSSIRNININGTKNEDDDEKTQRVENWSRQHNTIVS